MRAAVLSPARLGKAGRQSHFRGRQCTPVHPSALGAWRWAGALICRRWVRTSSLCTLFVQEIAGFGSTEG
ncbi:MAG: hypothetical protein ACP5VR_10190 [Acidimicrobiales bacterium]